MPILSILAAAVTIAQASASTVDDLGWMAGYWLSCGPQGEVAETWTDPRGGQMVGHSLTLTPRGRVDFEMLRIAMVDGVVAYHAQPRGQAPTVFKLVEGDGDHVVFQNLENDFPQRIRYRRQGADLMIARIEGAVDGREQSMEWRFDRRSLNARCPTA